MTDKQPTFKPSKRSKIVFLLSLIVAIFWYAGQYTSVYNCPLAGAIYEILWLPATGLLFALPVISAIYLFKEKFNIRSLYLYSLLIIGLTILFLRFPQF
jgi:hypothetical protein